jgi:hypothetical protein
MSIYLCTLAPCSGVFALIFVSFCVYVRFCTRNLTLSLAICAGNGQYSPDTGSWPQHPTQWWTGQIFVNVAGFAIFALFCEGIMNICAKISNPMNLSDIAFSEKVYGESGVVCAWFNLCVC